MRVCTGVWLEYGEGLHSETEKGIEPGSALKDPQRRKKCRQSGNIQGHEESGTTIKPIMTLVNIKISAQTVALCRNGFNLRRQPMYF